MAERRASAPGRAPGPARPTVRERRRLRRASAFLPPLVAFVALVLAAQGAVALLRLPPWLVPPPSAVLAALWRYRGPLASATLSTLAASALGFAASALAGVLAAVALASSRLAQRALYPYAVFFQTVPIVAIAPLLVIWFGYGIQTVAVSAFIVSVFPVIANTLTGLRSTDPALVDLFRLYGASGWTTLWKLRLPSALPALFTGLRVAAGLAVIGAIVAELFAASDGLGVTIKVHMTGRQTEVVFAGILLAALLGLALFGLVGFAAHLALRRWHASERES